MAKFTGYNVASIQSCGQFKRTHQFILETWEAIYRVMIHKFFDQQKSNPSGCQQHNSLLEDVQKALEAIPSSDFMIAFNRTLNDIQHYSTHFLQDFKVFISQMASSDDTWKYWSQFTFTDALAYVGLFLAIRSGDWNLRVACIKLMAPMFTAFNHTTYQKVLTTYS